MTRSTTRLLFALAALTPTLTACPSDDGQADGDGETAGDGDGDGDGDGAPGDGDGDGDGPECGDNTVDPGEECDDGNTEDGDGCTSTCTLGPCAFVWSYTEDVANSTAGAFDVALGDDGSIYAAGISINADNDAWVAKWNPDGTQAWSRSFDGGAGNDYAAALALAPGGEIYVAGKFAGAGDDLWYAALDASGTEQWSIQIDGGAVADGNDLGSGVALTPEGELVIVGRTRVADGDDDVWIRKAAAASGAEIWTTTWTGTGDGMFSTDRSGPVAVGSNGDIWVTAREHVDFDSQDATLLHFDGDGNFIAKFQPEGGGDQQQDPIDVVVAADAVYFAFAKGGFPYRGYLYKLGFDGAELWLKTEADWIPTDVDGNPIGDDWAVRGLGLDASGNLGVAGVFTNEEAGQGLSWGEAWVAKLDAGGDALCRGGHAVDDGNLIPPSLNIDGAGYGSAGFGLTGIETAGQGGATKLWTGFFQP